MHNDVGEIRRWKMKKIWHKKDKVNMAIGVIEREESYNSKKDFFNDKNHRIHSNWPKKSSHRIKKHYKTQVGNYIKGHN